MLCNTQNNISFKSSPLINGTMFIEDRVLLNKALIDGARDISTVLHTNNQNEREERIRKSCIAWTTAFLTPIITLPLTNRIALRYITKITPKFFAKENSIIEISNRYLCNKNLLKKGLEKLAQEKNKKLEEKLGRKLLKEEIIDYSEIVKKIGGDYEVLRKKLINAKTAVLSFDFLFTTTLLGGTGFINRYKTRKKTGREGFSAEFNMADNSLIEKRTEKFKKTEKLRDNVFIASLLLLTGSPLLLRKGLLKNSGALSKFIKKHAEMFDYNDGIFMKRLPFLLMMIVTDIGLLMSSRNQTEVKDNTVRLSATQIAFFGGDIVIGSALAYLSDKLFKTGLLDKNCKKNWINKIIPPIKPIRDLQGKNKAIATGLFWVNMLTLFSIVGIAIPKTLNKMIRHDVNKDVQAQNKNTVKTKPSNLPPTKPIRMEDFINRVNEQ